jgi:transcription elongation factor GreA
MVPEYIEFLRRQRPMERIPMTREGLGRLREELSRLEREERPANIRAIEEARGHGDLSENAEYHAAKERQYFIDGRINELRSIIGQSEIIEVDENPSDTVVFGKTVRLYDMNSDEESSYQLLGPYESAPEAGRISVTSPLGRALIGMKVGDEVRVNTPTGIQEFEILEIL